MHTSILKGQPPLARAMSTSGEPRRAAMRLSANNWITFFCLVALVGALTYAGPHSGQGFEWPKLASLSDWPKFALGMFVMPAVVLTLLTGTRAAGVLVLGVLGAGAVDWLMPLLIRMPTT